VSAIAFDQPSWNLVVIWLRVLVVSKKIPALFAVLTLSSVLPAYAVGPHGNDDEMNSEGVVVAVQLDPGAVRSAIAVNAEPMGHSA